MIGAIRIRQPLQKAVPLEVRALPCRQHAYAKCLPGYGAKDEVGCGATLMTYMDWQLHTCDPFRTNKRARRGYTDDRVVEM